MLLTDDTVLPFDAANFADPNGRIVHSAERLANAVIAALKDHEAVEVSLTKLLSASSSYFNTLLTRLVEAAGAGVLTRVHFTFASVSQREMWQRSRDAVLKNLDQHA